MDNEYLKKYYSKIVNVFLAEDDVFARAEKIGTIIDKIYSDGFEDGTNEGNLK